MGASPRFPPASALGCLLAPIIGFATVAAVDLGFSSATGKDLDFSEEWIPSLFQMLLVAAPFALLALAGVRGRSSWGVAIALTAALWGLYLADALSSRGDGTGANIGLGLVMLASPVFIAAAGFLTAKLAKVF